MITTHILDTSLGLPAADVLAKLEKKHTDHGWQMIGEAKTNSDGRIADFGIQPEQFSAGEFRLTFYVDSYFLSSKRDSFYPEIQVLFKTKDSQHYHVPLLLNPYGYSTYRGS